MDVTTLNPDDPYELEYNPVSDTDSYKYSHFMMYPEGLTRMDSYIESRGGHYGRTVWCGLQMILKRFLCRRIKPHHVARAAAAAAKHGEPFPLAAFERILTVHNGHWPIRIDAAPEGMLIPTGNILARIRSTDPEIPWIGSWVEDILMRVWFPTTVATKSYYCKIEILCALTQSSDDPMGEIYFKLHDFGARGVSSWESAGIGGAAHLFNFKGSDTLVGVEFANHYYNEEMAGFSIPASEHSVMILRGREGELAQMERIVEKFGKPGAVFACVSDSYDIFNAVENYWGDALHEKVRNSGSTVVIRPDSGDPSEVNVKILQILERKVGMRTNMKKFKVLPNYYRLIQGDGNKDEISIRTVLNALMAEGYSASNIAFGMGGGLLQQLDRDTQRFAMKPSQVVLDNEVLDVYKEPITDSGKKSKRGYLDLVRRDGQYQTVQGAQGDSLLVPVFENGKLLKDYTLAEVRANAERL